MLRSLFSRTWLPRIQFIELHDLDQTPVKLRHMVTEGLYTLWHLLWYYDKITPILSNALKRAKADTVIDLCAGAGGPLPSIQLSAHKKGLHDFSVRTTDISPAPESWKRVVEYSEQNGLEKGKIGYIPTSVDATACTETGFRTLFGSYHHFPPSMARKIIADAINTNQGIAIFEATERSIFNVLLMFSLILPILIHPLIAPFVKPFSWTRLFFTYIIPIIPLINAIDGTISCLRTYTPDEFMCMVKTIPGWENYEWDVNVQKYWIEPNFQYYIGIPKNPSAKAVSTTSSTNNTDSTVKQRRQ